MDFGARLRQARERRGKSLREIAESTKISPTVLDALEHNDLGRVPGGIFARAFVRAYAVEVGLDPDQTLREFLQMRPDAAREPAVTETEVPSGRRIARLWIGAALLAIGLAAAAATIWAWRARSGEAPGASAAWSTRAAAGDEGTVVYRGGPGHDVALAAGSRPAARADDPLPGRPVPAAAAADLLRGPAGAGVAGAVARPWRIAIHPRGPCWVRLVSRGEVLLARELRAGDREVREVSGTAFLEVGDAAAFEFSIDDRPGRALGGPGQVVRIRLGPDTIESFLDR
jgi:transcriptional regulator with XRE-family HTH domain